MGDLAESVSSGVRISLFNHFTVSDLKPVQTVKENCVRCYKERTKNYRLWFQAASELIKEERKYEQGHFLQKPLVGVF